MKFPVLRKVPDRCLAAMNKTATKMEAAFGTGDTQLSIAAGGDAARGFVAGLSIRSELLNDHLCIVDGNPVLLRQDNGIIGLAGRRSAVCVGHHISPWGNDDARAPRWARASLDLSYIGMLRDQLNSRN